MARGTFFDKRRATVDPLQLACHISNSLLRPSSIVLPKSSPTPSLVFKHTSITCQTQSTTNTQIIMASKPVFLIWGGEGWVAGHLKALLESQGRSFSRHETISKLTIVQERRFTPRLFACKTERPSSPSSRESSQPTS